MRRNPSTRTGVHQRVTALRALGSATAFVAGLALTFLIALAAPAPVADLRIARSGGSALLSWTHADSSARTYRLYRSDDQPYAAPGSTGSKLVATVTPSAGGATVSRSDPDAGIGDPKRNSYYTVTAVDSSGAASQPSNRVAEIDFPLIMAGSCAYFPFDNIWNTRIDSLPVDPRSADYINTIGPGDGLHADFGSGTWNGGPIGIPYNVVAASQPRVPVTFDYDDESDAGPYPIPPDVLIEGGPASDGDRHVLIVDRDNCVLYELYYAWPQADGSWTAGSGAIFDLKSHGLRPAGWTSADAAGLPILPGLVRYDEAASGAINHAIRFTVNLTRKEYVWPARHYASSSTDLKRPPMGQRFRLKSSFDISGFSPINQTILKALKTYGMFVADNGSDMFISGVPDEQWDNDDLHKLQEKVRASDFEAVDESPLMLNANSGQAKQP
jgi:hypothetical protein